MQVYHVDLGLSGSGYAGTATDPYSWADVLVRMQEIQTALMDSGSVFDSGMSFDGSVVDIVFKCRGRGELFNLENSIALEALNFSSTGSISFEADDPMRNGLPVLATPAFGSGSTLLPASTAWLDIRDSTNVKLSLSGFVLDINIPAGADAPYLVNNTGVAPVTKVANNIILDRGYGIRYVNTNGAGSRTAFAGNTVLVASTATGTHECVYAGSGSLYTGLNYVAQAEDTTAVVVFSFAGGSAYRNANAFALLGSAQTYQGGSPVPYADDVAGVLVKTQGLFNDATVDSVKASAAASLASGLTFLESSWLWPVHGGRLLAVGNTAVSPAIDLSATATDAFGHSRPVTTADAGAFQKSGLSGTEVLHVDLSQATAAGDGSESSPLGVAECLLDYSRRAPVDYTLNYVFRGSCEAAPIPAWDMGPLSPNTAAADRRYGGSGQILLSGYKTYNHSLPVFSAVQMRANANMRVLVERMKLEFVSGTNFIYGTVVGTGEMRLRSCVLRSRAAAQGRFVYVPTGTAKVRLRGCTVVQMHSVGTESGIFYFADESDVTACAVNMLNQTVVGTGLALVRGCSFSSAGAGVCTFPGATIDSYTELEASNAFVDPNNASYEAADFTLVSTSDAMNRLPSPTFYNDVGDDLVKDARELTRSAYPIGSKSVDAGAYEYDYYVPEPLHFYLDLSKSRSGAGTQGNRWSPADFQAWVDSSTGIVLDRSVRVHCVRSGVLSLRIQNLEADTNGSIDIDSDNDIALWSAVDAGNVVVHASSGLDVRTSGIMLRNESGVSAVRVHDCANTTVDLANTIVDNKRLARGYEIVINSRPAPADTITVSGTTLVPGTSFEATNDLQATAAELAKALSALVDVHAVAHGLLVVVSVPVLVNVTSLSAAYTISAVSAVIKGNHVLARGSSFNDEFHDETGVTGVVIEADTADVGYCAFQGQQFSGTTKSGAYVVAGAGTTFQNRYNAFSAASGTTDTGSASSALQLFTSLRAPDTSVAAFELAGSDSVDAFAPADLPVMFTGRNYQVDVRGNFRSRVFVNLAEDLFDVGAVERNYLSTTAAFTGAVVDPKPQVTEIGYSLDARAARGDIVFTLAGFAIGRGGYIFWDPTKPFLGWSEGSRGSSTITVTGTINAGSVTVTTPLGAVTVTEGADFDSGATTADTAAAIASALRASATFNSATFAVVDGSTVRVYAQLFGVVSGYSVSVTGTGWSATSFAPGTEPDGVLDQVYPLSGYSDWSSKEVPDPRSRSLVARVTDGSFVYGELVVIAVVHQSIFPEEVGKHYVFARVRMPVSTKHLRKTLIQRIILAY